MTGLVGGPSSAVLLPTEPDRECDCLECRIRHACGFQDGPQELSVAINALCSVLGECLAHYSTDKAKLANRLVLDLRKRWIKHPRVAVQHTVVTA